MIRMVCMLAAIAGALTLAGCSREPRIISSTIDVVTVRYWGDAAGAAAAKAREECARYGRRAKYRTANAGSTGEQEAIYDCIV